jgi:hypothetical protein
VKDPDAKDRDVNPNDVMSNESPNEDLRALVERARDGAEPSAENRARVRWLVEQRLSREAPNASPHRVRLRRGRSFVAMAIAGLALAFSGSAAALWWSGTQATAPMVAFEGEITSIAHVAEAAQRVRALPHAETLSDVVTAVSTTGDAAPEVKRRASPDRTKEASKSLGLAEEAALLARAQKATNQGDSTAALRLLAEYDDRYATGALAQERSMARILALCESGLVEAARREARGYGKRFPNSPQAARIGNTCVTEPRSETVP